MSVIFSRGQWPNTRKMLAHQNRPLTIVALRRRRRRRRHHRRRRWRLRGVRAHRVLMIHPNHGPRRRVADRRWLILVFSLASRHGGADPVGQDAPRTAARDHGGVRVVVKHARNWVVRMTKPVCLENRNKIFEGPILCTIFWSTSLPLTSTSWDPLPFTSLCLSKRKILVNEIKTRGRWVQCAMRPPLQKCC